MLTFKKFRRKGDKKERGLTGFGAVALMEHSVLHKIRESSPILKAQPWTATPAILKRCHPRESLSVGSLACRGIFTEWLHSWIGKALMDHSSGMPYAESSHVTMPCHTWASSGALPFTGRVLCATAARWLKWKTGWEWWERASLLTRAVLWATESSRTGRATTAACQKFISNSLFHLAEGWHVFL